MMVAASRALAFGEGPLDVFEFVLEIASMKGDLELLKCS